MLVVVMAIVLLLVNRGWREATPLAIDLTHPSAARSPRIPAESASALDGLPGLDDVRRGTDAHAREVADALEKID